MDEFRSGDEFLLGAIDGSSAGRDIISVKLPRTTRPIDPANQRRVRATKSRLKQLLANLNLKQKTGHTDILGPVYAAALRFSKTAAQEKYLLLFSDLEDNIRQTVPSGAINLKNVPVTAFFVAGKNIQEDTQLRQKWTAFFNAAGTHIDILNVSESRYQAPILTK
jgi:hypothetical protein